MRLLRSNQDGTFSFTKYHGQHIPPYAILSHTWGSDHEEVTFKDIINNDALGKVGYDKLRFCARQAEHDDLHYFWVDTCCINKSSSMEVSEAINSMFRWYHNAAKCYVYLTDVSTIKEGANCEGSEPSWGLAFRHSRWFTRCWTLPELLAPPDVKFFSLEGEPLGDRLSLVRQIHEVTEIPILALQGAYLSEFTIEERFSWAQNRTTGRQEDEAYCLLGIFDVKMPVLYGEGRTEAFKRLYAEIFESPGISQARTPFLYFPLEVSQIRILVLHPGQQDEDLSAHLKHRYISDDPNYQALSYVWGQEPALHSLCIGECEQIAIRPNLFHALHRMRHRTKPVHLWVDSICINQCDEEERNSQVQRMGDIFRKARNVGIWLGEEYSHSSTAMDLMSQISQPGFQWRDLWWNQHDFVAFNNLLGRPWFQRGWVLQEAAFSRSSVVLCGDRQTKWRDLTESVTLIREHINTALLVHTRLRPQMVLDNFHESSACRLLSIVDQSREADRVVKQLSLETLVELGTHFETTDPRDAIYALVNLANDISPASLPHVPGTIVPDYRKSTLDVFADFVLHCCNISNSLDIICRPWAPVQLLKTYTQQETHQHGQSRELRIPSWIQTRDQLPCGNPSGKSSYRIHGNSLVERSRTRVYNAHCDTRPRTEVLRCIEHGVLCLTLRSKGVSIGYVTQRSMRMANAIITNDCLSVLRGAYPDQETGLSNQTEAVWRTLCADLLNRQKTGGHSITGAVQRLWHHFEIIRTVHDAAVPTESAAGIDVEEVLEGSVPQDINEYLQLVRQCVWNRRTFRGIRDDGSHHIFAGLIPRYAQLGDKLCVLYGCSVPVVLRKYVTDTGSCYWQLIGEAYVHGYMDGEALSLLSPTELASAEVEFDIR